MLRSAPVSRLGQIVHREAHHGPSCLGFPVLLGAEDPKPPFFVESKKQFADITFRAQDIARIEEITIYDDTAAKVVMTVGMAGTNDGLLGFSADAYRFALELEKPVGDWQLISARWGELGDEMQ